MTYYFHFSEGTVLSIVFLYLKVLIKVIFSLDIDAASSDII